MRQALIASKAWCRGAAILYGLVLLILLLYPFNFHLPSSAAGANKLLSSNGVEFDSFGAIRSRGPIEEFYRSLISGEGLTIEVWLETKSLRQRGPARIVSCSSNKGSRNFTLGQDKEYLEIRLRTTKNDLNGTQPSVRVPTVFQTGVTQHLVVTYDYTKEKAFLDGREVRSSPLEGDFSNWDVAYPLILGNEATGNRPWFGKIFLVAIYNRCLSPAEVRQNFYAGQYFKGGAEAERARVTEGLTALYLFDSNTGGVARNWSRFGPSLDLEVVSEAQVWERFFLIRSRGLLPIAFAGSEDVVANLLAFIPFGFLWSLSFQGTYSRPIFRTFIVLVGGLSLSLSAESFQYYLPSRVSSLNDVVNNTMGTALGIAMALVISYVRGALGSQESYGRS